MLAVPSLARCNWIAGDALAVPLRSGCCAAVFCIAALGLFADRRAALREMRRVLRPGGLALLATGTQAWAPLVRWPAALAIRLRAAYARALAEGCRPLAATPDLGGELAKWLEEAGFATPHVRAFLLDAATHPLEAELPLLPWARLRPLLAAQLAPEDLAACDRLAAGADAELCAIALIAQARSPC
jgi:SAM-dependent methyltransferase